jgi:hypothetical protein
MVSGSPLVMRQVCPTCSLVMRTEVSIYNMKVEVPMLVKQGLHTHLMELGASMPLTRLEAPILSRQKVPMLMRHMRLTMT